MLGVKMGGFDELNSSRPSPGVPPTVTPTLPFSEVASNPTGQKLDLGGVAVDGAPGTPGTRV